MNGHTWELIVIGKVVKSTWYISPPQFQGMRDLSDTWRCSMCGALWATNRPESESPRLPHLYPGTKVPTCQEVRDSILVDIMDS